MSLRKKSPRPNSYLAVYLQLKLKVKMNDHNEVIYQRCNDY